MTLHLAIEQFGDIDTWVNNAGVGMYGKLTETPLADKRRLFDVDFWASSMVAAPRYGTCARAAAQSSTLVGGTSHDEA